MSDTMEVVDLSTLINMDDEPQCEHLGTVGEPDIQCTSPAKWVAQMSCGHPTMACASHRTTSPGYDVFECDCGAETYPHNLIWYPI